MRKRGGVTQEGCEERCAVSRYRLSARNVSIVYCKHARMKSKKIEKKKVIVSSMKAFQVPQFRFAADTPAAMSQVPIFLCPCALQHASPSVWSLFLLCPCFPQHREFLQCLVFSILISLVLSLDIGMMYMQCTCLFINYFIYNSILAATSSYLLNV